MVSPRPCRHQRRRNEQLYTHRPACVWDKSLEGSLRLKGGYLPGLTRQPAARPLGVLPPAAREPTASSWPPCCVAWPRSRGSAPARSGFSPQGPWPSPSLGRLGPFDHCPPGPLGFSFTGSRSSLAPDLKPVDLRPVVRATGTPPGLCPGASGRCLLPQGLSVFSFLLSSPISY